MHSGLLVVTALIHVSLRGLSAGPSVLGILPSPRGETRTLEETDDNAVYRLPDDFLFGAGSSNYQVEGAWNLDEEDNFTCLENIPEQNEITQLNPLVYQRGKGESQIDHYYHYAKGGENGDVADDSYHKFKEDIQMLEYLKFNAYRFSLSWSRLLPTGSRNNTNKDGVNFYNSLLDELLAKNITPVVTLYHLEHPQALEDEFGGWLSPKMVDAFAEYAEFAFQTFGSKVKWWTTLNEPHIYAILSYGLGMFAPGKKSPGKDEYLCVHHMILAHARAYHLYHGAESKFDENGGKIGISLESYFARPKTTSYTDILAAERRNTFELAWAADPLLTGDYPPLMRRVVDEKCASEGQRSRLPHFSDAQKQQINGTLDFLGLNAYFGLDATDGVAPYAGNPSFDRDSGVLALFPGDSPDVPPPLFHHGTPWSIRESLLWLKNRYGDVPVFITENGIGSDTETNLDDSYREVYFSTYLRQLLRALHVDKCNVIGYLGWSLLDSFEWTSYQTRFGLIHVDYSSPNKTRTPKQSSQFFRKIMTERYVPEITTSGCTSRYAAVSTLHCLFATLLLNTFVSAL